MTSGASPFWPPIHPDQLDWLICRLKRVGSFVDVRDLASTRVPATERVFVLSFDDGYSDFLQHALPVIESHGISSNLDIVAESSLNRPTHLVCPSLRRTVAIRTLGSGRCRRFDARGPEHH